MAPLQVRERAVMDTAVLWLPYRQCMAKKKFGFKYYVRHLNEKILGGQAVLCTNEPNFKIMCNCINELLNVFSSMSTYYVKFACVKLHK